MLTLPFSLRQFRTPRGDCFSIVVEICTRSASKSFAAFVSQFRKGILDSEEQKQRRNFIKRCISIYNSDHFLYLCILKIKACGRVNMWFSPSWQKYWNPPTTLIPFSGHGDHKMLPLYFNSKKAFCTGHELWLFASGSVCTQWPGTCLQQLLCLNMSAMWNSWIMHIAGASSLKKWLKFYMSLEMYLSLEDLQKRLTFKEDFRRSDLLD